MISSTKGKLKEKKEQIKINEEYINWLDKFTGNKLLITSDMYLFRKNRENSMDIENVESLEALYYVISDYAKANYIMPEQEEFGNFYKITHNNNDYKIGYIAGQEVFFYCRKTKFTKEKEIINFNDIIENKHSLGNDLIDLKMGELRLLLNELKLANVDESFIQEEVHKTYYKKRK